VIERCRLNARTISAETLAAPIHIQGYPTDGMGAMFHAVEHMSYHTGQIVYWTKVLISGRAEIEFYPQHEKE